MSLVRSDASCFVASQAGWRLAQCYGRQFVKVLDLVRDDFLPRLAAEGDAEPYVVRLREYVSRREFATQPEGRALPERDVSSQHKGGGD